MLVGWRLPTDSSACQKGCEQGELHDFFVLFFFRGKIDMKGRKREYSMEQKLVDGGWWMVDDECVRV
jgi:hypothetical protein